MKFIFYLLLLFSIIYSLHIDYSVVNNSIYLLVFDNYYHPLENISVQANFTTNQNGFVLIPFSSNISINNETFLISNITKSITQLNAPSSVCINMSLSFNGTMHYYHLGNVSEYNNSLIPNEPGYVVYSAPHKLFINNPITYVFICSNDAIIKSKPLANIHDLIWIKVYKNHKLINRSVDVYYNGTYLTTLNGIVKYFIPTKSGVYEYVTTHMKTTSLTYVRDINDSVLIYDINSTSCFLDKCKVVKGKFPFSLNSFTLDLNGLYSIYKQKHFDLSYMYLLIIYICLVINFKKDFSVRLLGFPLLNKVITFRVFLNNKPWKGKIDIVRNGIYVTTLNLSKHDTFIIKRLGKYEIKINGITYYTFNVVR